MTQSSKRPNTISGRGLALIGGIGLVACGVFALGANVAGGKASQVPVQEPPMVNERPPVTAILSSSGETANLERLLVRVNGFAPALNVTDSSIQGIKRVEIAGGPVVYLSADGKYLLEGKLLDISGEEPVDPSQAAVKQLIASIAPAEWIAFGPEKPSAVIYVLTDLECGYCRKLHGEVPMLHALGIQVRYLSYPRQGEGSSGWTKAVDVWCARDRRAAFELVTSGGEVPAASCESPVAKHYALGQSLQVEGTPTIILENGTVLTGFYPATYLAELALKSRSK